MEEPTEVQQRWFWEQLGLTYFNDWYYSTEGERPFEYGTPIDVRALPYLFKYAVPKLENYHLGSSVYGHTAIVWRHSTTFKGVDKDPAVALFWAIFKCLGGKE